MSAVQTTVEIQQNAKNIHAKLQSLRKTFTSGVEKSLDKIDNTLESNKIRSILHFLDSKTKQLSPAVMKTSSSSSAAAVHKQRYSLAKTSES